MYHYLVYPLKKSFDSLGLHYMSHELLSSGDLVQIPLGEDAIFGIIAKQDTPLTQDFELKEIITSFPDYSLPPSHANLARFIASHYMTLIHHSASLLYPKHLLTTLEKGKYPKKSSGDYSYPAASITLSDAQSSVYSKISHEAYKKYILYGVTGSGKTQIYMKLIADNLARGKQSLVLIPEIILTSQIASRLSRVFGDDVIILTSSVSAAQKTKYWMDIREGRAKVIVGTRSALFYPYTNLGVIIVDEEHDNSYISDSAPRYNALTVASELARNLDIPILLGSGTPSAESFLSLKYGAELLQLLEVYN